MAPTATQAIRQRLQHLARDRARSQRDEARSLDGIAEALSRGREHGLTIKEMASLGGITRQTAYTLLERRTKAAAR